MNRPKEERMKRPSSTLCLFALLGGICLAAGHLQFDLRGNLLGHLEYSPLCRKRTCGQPSQTFSTLLYSISTDVDRPKIEI